ncbi:MAG: hypothetical protein ACLQGP_15770 [Isosphaeraceae bacterium]
MQGTRWPHKPPAGYEIDSEHPLARGLISFLPLNPCSLFDIVGGIPLAMSGASWSSGSQSGLLLTANNSGATTTKLPQSLQGGWPITVACGFRQLATPANSAVLFGTSYETVASSPYFGWVLGYYGVSGVKLAWNSAGTAGTINGSSLPATGADAVLSATITSTAQSVYLNGVPYCSGSSSLSNPTYQSTAQLFIGIEPGTTNRPPGTLMYWCGAWSRALQPAEHITLARNPWQIFEPRRLLKTYVFGIVADTPTVYTLSGPSSGGAGGTVTFTLAVSMTHANDTVTLSVSGDGGGTLTLPFDGGVASQVFTFTPSGSGVATITATSANGDTVTGSPFDFTVVPNYTMTPPGSLSAISGQPSGIFTVTPASATTDTITLSDGGAGGVFRNSVGTIITSLSWSNSSSAETFTYTPTSPGDKTISLTSAGGAVITSSSATLSPVTTVGFTLTSPSPASGLAGVPSGAYTLTPDAPTNDVITLSDGGGGGIFTPPVLTFTTALFAPQTFTYTPR